MIRKDGLQGQFLLSKGAEKNNGYMAFPRFTDTEIEFYTDFLLTTASDVGIFGFSFSLLDKQNIEIIAETIFF